MAADLTNYYILARRAIHDENYNDAIRFYETVLLNNPNDWEARFYTYYAQTELADFRDLDDRLDVFANALYNIFSELVRTNMPEEWRTEHILQCTRYITVMPGIVMIKYYDAHQNAIINCSYMQMELCDDYKCYNLLACYRLCYMYCDIIEFYFANNAALLKAILDLRKTLASRQQQDQNNYHKDNENSLAYLQENINKIQLLEQKINMLNI